MIWRARAAAIWQFCSFGSVPLLAVAWLVGWVLGDRPNLLVWFYYIPAPAVALLGTGWCWSLRARAPRILYATTLFLTLLAAGKVALVDFRFSTSPAAEPGAMRVVHWNVAYALFGQEALFRRLSIHQPDLVFLSEYRYSDQLKDESLTKLGLNYALQDQGMAFLSRFPITTQGDIPLPNARAWWARVGTPRGTLDVVMVDLISHPYLDRDKPLKQLAAWVAQHDATVPLLIVGDFNTPRDARAFRSLRAYLRNAYEVAGRGWPYSWPLPFPVYSLDHTWFGPNLHVTNYRLYPSLISDHLRQVMDVEIVQPQH